MNIGFKGIELLKRYESIHDGDLNTIGLQPKMDPKGIWTIAWGHAIIYKGTFLRGMINKKIAYSLYPSLTLEEAQQWLEKDLVPRENQVNSLKLNINQPQFDSLVDFVYNEGFGNLLSSTLLKRVKSGVGDITEAFSRFNKANIDGVLIVLPGLTFRRQSEAHLYLTGELKFFN